MTFSLRITQKTFFCFFISLKVILLNCLFRKMNHLNSNINPVIPSFYKGATSVFGITTITITPWGY